MTTAVTGVFTIGNTPVRLTREDITLLEVDGFVFYASHDLKLGAGYGTAISSRGGPGVQRELNELGPVETGDVVVTAGGKLPAEYILHAVGPRFKEPGVEGKLRRTMARVMEHAESLEIRRIAFPPMGAGYYGIPAAQCARVMRESLASHLQGETGIEEVIICVLDSDQERAFAHELEGEETTP